MFRADAISAALATRLSPEIATPLGSLVVPDVNNTIAGAPFAGDQ